MLTRLWSEIATLQEVTAILGGKPEAVSYKGKTETYRRGSKAVEVERELMFDDDGYNSWSIREVKP